MGLFNFLKNKHTSIPGAAQVIISREECDINKTALVAELLKIPRSKRGDSWYNSFYENIATASFRSSSPQLLTGPDGFPYFILRTPEPNVPFESFCIKNMIDQFALHKGWGVVFNPAEDKSADWVFTYGGIVNYHLNQEFWSATDQAATANIAFENNVGIIQKAEKVMIAQPSENYLPNATRHAIKVFLQSKGIKTPKMMMITSVGEGTVSRKLVFNIHPEDYPVVSKLDFLMQQIGWFLPNNYLLVPLSRDSELASGFHNM